MRHTAMKRTSAFLLATGLVFGVAACSDDSDDDATDSTEAPGGDESSEGTEVTSDATITISGSQFTVVALAAGEAATLSNTDGFTHTVTSDDDAWEEVRLDGGSTGELPVLDAGEYAFHCEIHRSMTGTLVVS